MLYSTVHLLTLPSAVKGLAVNLEVRAPGLLVQRVSLCCLALALTRKLQEKFFRSMAGEADKEGTADAKTADT